MTHTLQAMVAPMGEVMGDGKWDQSLPIAGRVDGVGIRVGVECAGILPEAWALADLGINHTIVWATEKSKGKQSILRHLHGEQLKIYETVEATSEARAAGVDLLTGGVPCQPFSALGLGLGAGETLGIVVFQILAWVKKHRPRLVVLENVKGLVQHHWEEFKEFRARVL